MFVILVIIAILLVFILAALVPDFWEILFGLVGVLVGSAILIIGSVFLIVFLGNSTKSQQSKTVDVEHAQFSDLYRAKLENILNFTQPVNCQMSRNTQSLFENLIIFDPPNYIGRRGPSVTVPGFGTSTPAFTRTVIQRPGLSVRDNEAILAMRGSWHGLKVGSIRVRRKEETNFWEYQIRFSEPPSRVRSTLNNIGFDLPPVGEFRQYTKPGEVPAGIGIEEISDGSALYCGSTRLTPRTQH